MCRWAGQGKRNINGTETAHTISLLKPEKIIAIGCDAHRAVKNLGVNSIQTRHPSYGGQNVFIRQIEAAYGLASEKAPSLFSQRVS